MDGVENMKDYKMPVLSISKFSNKDFNFLSLSARDYRKLRTNNQNTIKLCDLLETKHKVGKEIGSESYMPKSNHRFLKTVNISKNFLLAESTFEYCKPINKVFPRKNEILIAKDGGGDGLGEVCLYPYENKENLDSISAGVLAINVIENNRYYVFGILKSQHFKDYIDLNTAQGSTIRHSKVESLNYEIPFPTKNNHAEPQKIEQLVSLIVQNIINKEEQIKAKNQKIDELIERELQKNQKPSNGFTYFYPTISEIKQETRLDTGIYEREFKEIDFLIKNYEGGNFFIQTNKIKSGNTPEVRILGNNQRFKYLWMTPTNISDYGGYNEFERIQCDNYNLNKDSILLINRTSKGGKGEYVGITSFYDASCFGKGQHNQGIYRVSDYPKNTLLFLTCFMNCQIIRKYCTGLSIGSKMKEIKSDQFLKIPFPNFPEPKQQEIAKEYYNKIDKNQNLTLENYLQKEIARNQQIGIFQINMEIFELREKLGEIIDKIINDLPIEINLNW